MSTDQVTLFAIAGATIVLFLWGRWRHDLVAMASLLACVLTGVVPADEAFGGFGHPAVITVACVLVLSHGLQATGAIDLLAQRVVSAGAGPSLSIAALIGLGTVLSAFINNVGAMALLLPVGVQLAARHDLAPGRVLMPLSFGTILGGMTTLIGTPPNLLVSAFRVDTGAGSFAMFDFSPVGVAVAGAGLVFIVLLGWRLVPARERVDETGFDTGAYLTEVRVTDDSKGAGKTLGEFEAMLDDADTQVVGLVRNEVHVVAPNPGRVLQPGDILVLEADAKTLGSVLTGLGLTLEEGAVAQAEEAGDSQPGKATTERTRDDGDGRPDGGRGGDIELQELVVMSSAPLAGRTARSINLRTVFGLNLLAISRQGRRSIKRLRSTAIKAGDVLLMQGPPDALAGFAAEFGCVPLAARSIGIPDRRRLLVAGLVMLLGIGAAASGLLPAAIAFAGGVLAFLLLGVMSPRGVYQAVDWPIIVLLGALLPVAGAMGTTGAADLLAQGLLDTLAQGRPVIALALILIASMTLSDFMNNAATAAVMCPIAISTADRLGVGTDPFLMAVAVGASCAFLTPIGHQNNTLILGPGGFRFGDYWRLGLPMEVLVVLVAVPMLLLVWPL